METDRGARDIAIDPCEQRELAVLVIFDSYGKMDNQAILCKYVHIRGTPDRGRGNHPSSKKIYVDRGHYVASSAGSR